MAMGPRLSLHHVASKLHQTSRTQRTKSRMKHAAPGQSTEDGCSRQTIKLSSSSSSKTCLMIRKLLTQWAQ